MALFTDGLICDTEQIREYESSILSVAKHEGIELTPKLRVAQREIGLEIVTFLLRHGQEYIDRRRRLDHVVVDVALRHWHAVHSLAAIYRDAHHQRMNDRHREKWAHYSQETRGARQTYFSGGVAVVRSPIPRATAPVTGSLPGGPQARRSLFVAASYETGGTSGALSLPVAVELPNGSLLSVSVPALPEGVEGWHVFAGSRSDEMTRQNGPRLAAGEAWIEPSGGLIAGPPAQDGQAPDEYVRAAAMAPRG